MMDVKCENEKCKKEMEENSLSDKISDGALCEYGNVLLIEDVKQKMDDIKGEIEESYIGDISDDGRKEVIEIIDKHLGKELK